MSTNQLLERMRKLRDEKAAAAAAAAATAAGGTSTSTAASSSPTTTGSASSPQPSASGRGAGGGGVPSPGSQLLANMPPALVSPSTSALQYRDVIHDPLCAVTRAATIAKLAEIVLLQSDPSVPSSAAATATSTGTTTLESSTVREQCARLATLVGGGGGGAKMSRALRKRGRDETGDGDVTTGGGAIKETAADAARQAEASVIQELRPGLAAKAYAVNNHHHHETWSPAEKSAPHSLFSDERYRAQCVAASVAVDGAEREPCVDVNKYDRVDRLAQGVYGVVFSARLAAPASSDQLFAIKHIKKRWLEDSEIGFPPYLLREFDLLFRLRHPNVVAARELALLDPLLTPGRSAFASHAEQVAAVETAHKVLSDDQQVSGPEAKRSAQALVHAVCGDDAARAPSIYVGTPASVKDVFLVMDFCPRDLRVYMNGVTESGACFLHVSSRNAHPDVRRAFLSRVKCIAFQLFNGLAFLHANRVLHRDLKPSNVLIDHDGFVKLCDFGLARLYREGQALTPNVVTRMYRAPELAFGLRDYSHALDVWAATCILAELFLRRPLFESPDGDVAHMRAICNVLGIPNETTFTGLFHVPKARDVVREIGVWNREDRLADVFAESVAKQHNTDASLIPESGLDLLRQLLRWNPADRLSAAEALQHPFFTEEPLPCAPSELLTPLPFQPSA